MAACVAGCAADSRVEVGEDGDSDCRRSDAYFHGADARAIR